MAFLHFLLKFDDFSKFLSTFGVLHFEKSSNMAKKWRRAFVWPISTLYNVLRVPETRISGNCSATKLFHAWKVRLIFKQYDGGSEDSLTDGHEIFFCTYYLYFSTSMVRCDVKKTRSKSLIFSNSYIRVKKHVPFYGKVGIIY